MLRSGFIQPCRNAFSFPVPLVRKKDGPWRFGVDYRMLNTLTVKSKFPILVINELLDEPNPSGSGRRTQNRLPN